MVPGIKRFVLHHIHKLDFQAPGVFAFQIFEDRNHDAAVQAFGAAILDQARQVAGGRRGGGRLLAFLERQHPDDGHAQCNQEGCLGEAVHGD